MRARLRSLASSFTARLAIGYLVVVAVLAGVWVWSLYGPLTQAAIDQQRAHLQTIAQVSVLALADSTSTPAADVARLVSRAHVRMTLVASDGTVLADSAQDPSRMTNHATRPEIAAALRGQVGFATRRSATLSVDQMYVAVPATLRGAHIVLRVSEPLAQVRDIAVRGRETGLLLLLGSLIVAVFVALRLSRLTAEPVLNLRDAARAMAAGDLRAQIPAAVGELGDLSRSLTALRDTMRGTIAELESGQSTLRAVLDGLQEAVFVFDGETVALANRAARAVLHAPAKGWDGATLAEVGMPASLTEAVRLRLGCNAPCSGEVGPDPQARYHRITAVPLAELDQPARTLIVITDVTGVRRLDAVRRDFVANASHELKTPTAAIQLLAEAASTAESDGDTEQALAFVRQMKEEAARLRRLVVDLLDLSRLETEPQPGSVTDMRTTVGNALAAHRAAASAAGLTLQLDDSAVAGRDVYAAADPTDVAIVLDNLLANAIAYTERGGASVRLGADEAAVVLSVADTGPGIAGEHLPRIFERFYRVDPARSRASGGTGLGLSLVRNAVERSGGTVTVSSTPGRGTTFTIRLPRAR